MHTAHDRYTDSDLIKMLQIVVSDYNKKPTQREILTDNRLPTHHTYRKRFGTLVHALDAAGVGNVPREASSLHDTIKDCLVDCAVVREWVTIGSIVVDFEVTTRTGEVMLIDLIDLQSSVEPNIQQSIAKMRQAIADAYRGGRTYLSFSSAIEAVRHVTTVCN